jgi:FkbM family methyltransferase
VAEVECAPGDLSVSASLLASGGDWEPHIRRYLESVVQPDWVCLDIGANIGVHTLSLGALAHDGRVVAFEADAANFALLARNAEALGRKRASIEPVHVALWDSQGTLICGGADELAGCSFVADDVSDRSSVERRLRSVVASEAIDGTELHMRLTEVPALTLDSWMEQNPLPHLNLIKLDVEGAEARVIRGADATLRRHRPILVVEYNPSCAEAYFGQAPDALFRELEARFDSIWALEPDGSLTPIVGWAALEARLAGGKGWEDLVCRAQQWNRPEPGGCA